MSAGWPRRGGPDLRRPGRYAGVPPGRTPAPAPAPRAAVPIVASPWATPLAAECGMRCNRATGADDWRPSAPIMSCRWERQSSADPASRIPQSGEGPLRLPLDVDEILEDLVRTGDHARVRLEGALRADHVGELLGEIDVRAFQHAGADVA